MRTDDFERAIRLLEDGRVSYEALSSKDADAIIEAHISLDELIADGVAHVAGLTLFAELGLSRLAIPLGTEVKDPVVHARSMLERLRRELRAVTLAKVSSEPLEQWSPAVLRRAEHVLGGEVLGHAARSSYLDALRAGLPAADAIGKRFSELIDDVGVLRAKHDGVEAATSGRATMKKLAFLTARIADGTLDPARFQTWAREQYLVAMYGRRVRADLAVALAANVDVDSVPDADIARGRAKDILIDPLKIELEDLPIIDEAVRLGFITKVERDEALRATMCHQFEQGAAGDRIAMALELALGFVEWGQPALKEARLRGLDREMRLLLERRISAEQMEYLEAAVVRGQLTREELDRARTQVYLELRFGPNPRPEEAENMRSYSSDAAWLEHLPARKPCWVGDVDLAAKLRSTLGAQASAFRTVAEAIIDWLPLSGEPSQIRASFDALLATLDSNQSEFAHRAIDQLRNVPAEIVRVGIMRAVPIIDAIVPTRRRAPPVPRRRAASGASSVPSPARRARAPSDPRGRAAVRSARTHDS